MCFFISIALTLEYLPRFVFFWESEQPDLDCELGGFVFVFFSKNTNCSIFLVHHEVHVISFHGICRRSPSRVLSICNCILPDAHRLRGQCLVQIFSFPGRLEQVFLEIGVFGLAWLGLVIMTEEESCPTMTPEFGTSRIAVIVLRTVPVFCTK